MGAEKITTKEYNGVNWEIYYLKSGNFNLNYNIDPVTPQFQSGYFCFASGKNGDYVIGIKSGLLIQNNSVDSELFKDYVEPFLNNITLKDPENNLKEYQIINSTKESYNYLKNFVKNNGWEEIKDYNVY
ncbi:hypothetical protein ALNOE001_08680 [Candidatus Methanobinarius endosymbioticus]|uniref:Uncharacterized protein n=1 Tax=Candidatus Methanobinarius endosymbioticus TaxID=2006182 RepID=A0A366MBB6_9EURY|nr:hypothetical protein ALNOE001_08680 [Candidatus Methanobinarius endosymbioticus]